MSGSGPVVEVLTWDSEWWGVSTARTTCGSLDPELAADVAAACATLGVELLYHLGSASDAASLRLAQQLGYRVVDIRQSMEAPVRHDATTPGGDAVVVRPAREDDVARLGAIAAASHRNSRFFADGRLPSERCEALYRRWIEADVEGRADQVLVAQDGDAVLGYVSLSADAGRGRIGLIAVDEAARGSGAGGALVDAAHAWCRDGSLTDIDVVTQGASVAAQRLYQRFGFRTVAVDLWFHRWSS